MSWRGAVLVLLTAAACGGASELDSRAAELAHADRAVRYRAARALVAMGQAAAPATGALARAVSADADDQVRLEAARALAAIGPAAAAAVPALRDGLGDESPFVRFEAARALGMFGVAARDAVESLAALLTQEGLEASTRDMAATALGEIGPDAAAAVPQLVQAMRDNSHAAADALGRVGPRAADAVPALAEVVIDPKASVDVREAAAWSLGRIGRREERVIQALRVAMAQGVAGARESLVLLTN